MSVIIQMPLPAARHHEPLFHYGNRNFYVMAASVIVSS